MFGGGARFGGWVVILVRWVVVNVGEEKEFDRGERKRNQKILYMVNGNHVYMHGYCSFARSSCIFRHFYKN